MRSKIERRRERQEKKRKPDAAAASSGLGRRRPRLLLRPPLLLSRLPPPPNKTTTTATTTPSSSQDEGRARYGAPLRVTPFNHPESGEPWGFDLDILSLSSSGNDSNDPISAKLRIGFDDGIVNKRQWVGRGTDGFPKMEGTRPRSAASASRSVK